MEDDVCRGDDLLNRWGGSEGEGILFLLFSRYSYPYCCTESTTRLHIRDIHHPLSLHHT